MSLVGITSQVIQAEQVSFGHAVLLA